MCTRLTHCRLTHCLICPQVAALEKDLQQEVRRNASSAFGSKVIEEAKAAAVHCALIKISPRLRADRRVDLHAIDATPARWRGGVGLTPLDSQVEIEMEVHWRGVSSLVYRQRRTEALLAIGEVVREHGASFAVWDAVLSKSGVFEGPRNNNGATELDTSPSYIQS